MKKIKKLKFSTETVKVLSDAQLGRVAGGATALSCPGGGGTSLRADGCCSTGGPPAPTDTCISCFETCAGAGCLYSIVGAC